MGLGFGPRARLAGRRDFRRVFEEGRKFVGRNLNLWLLRTGSKEPARLGLSVSSKVGIAVRRNRLKRLVREAFRHNRQALAEGWDMVVYLRPGCRWQGLQEAKDDFMQLCRKAGP